MNLEELKSTIRGNGFQESHGSEIMVIDVEVVIELLGDLSLCSAPNCKDSISKQHLTFSDWCSMDKENAERYAKIIDSTYGLESGNLYREYYNCKLKKQ